MYSPPVKSSSKPIKSRLGLKMAAIFAATFLIIFVGLLFFDLFRLMGEKTLVEAAVANQSSVSAIDPKIETDLAKVLEYNDAQNTADIKNPFADQAGISSLATAAQTAALQSSSAAKSDNSAQNNQQKNQASQTVAAKTVQPNQAVNPQPQMDTRARLQLRDERIRLGEDGGPEAAVFAINDLLPVGVVSGGNGNEEVMFFSEAACRVVSFPVGTQFFDGWFDSLRDEGVVFGFYDQFRTRRMRAWGRSVNQQCSPIGLLENSSPNQALTMNGGD